MKKTEDDGNESEAHTREADLPNVISNTNDVSSTSAEGMLGKVKVEVCPEIGDKKDRELGCALEFLKAGTAQKFIASLK